MARIFPVLTEKADEMPPPGGQVPVGGSDEVISVYNKRGDGFSLPFAEKSRLRKLP